MNHPTEHFFLLFLIIVKQEKNYLKKILMIVDTNTQHKHSRKKAIW